MARRVLLVLGALAAVAGVAVLARPPSVEVPPPFTVERVTPTPPAPDPRPSPSPDVPPTPTPAPVAAAGRGTLTIHPVDGRTLEHRGEAVAVPVTAGYLHTELSRDDGLLVVATARAQPDAGTIVQVYETGALHEPPRELAVPAFADWLEVTPESSALVWLTSRMQGLQHLEGLRIAGGGGALGRVQLPGEARVHSVAALTDERVGLVVLTAAPEGSRELLGVRLLVADLATGRLAAELALPVAHSIGAGGSRRTDLLPGVAWDVERDRLYVAHAGRDAVTVVDLGGPRVDAQLGAVTGDAAAGDGEWRRALLSGDGSMLYVHGAGNGSESTAGAVLPLLAVDLAAGAPLDVPDPPEISVLAVAASGEHVVGVAGAVTAGAVTPQSDLTLQVLDGHSLEERWSLALDAPAVPWARFTREGELLAVARPARGMSPPTTQLDVFAAATGELVATRSFAGLLVDFHPDTGLVLVRSLD